MAAVTLLEPTPGTPEPTLVLALATTTGPVVMLTEAMLEVAAAAAGRAACKC